MNNQPHPSVNMDIPKPGEVPFESGIYKEPARPDIDFSKGAGKGGGGVNKNESQMNYLFMSIGCISLSQWNTLLHFKEDVEGMGGGEAITTTNIGEFVGGGGGPEAKITALIDCGRYQKLVKDAIGPEFFDAIYCLAISNMSMDDISARMKRNGIAGWSKNLRIKKLKTAINEMSVKLPPIRRIHGYRARKNYI